MLIVLQKAIFASEQRTVGRLAEGDMGWSKGQRGTTVRLSYIQQNQTMGMCLQALL